ncbi:MAG: murein biosynthesis integral membrane protein MurJ, partial [Candidatus Schekmanbacteria bacterium]
MAGAIFIISALTLLSRIVGFGREIILANYFGISEIRGAFTVAFKIPNLLRTLLTETAISAAFIPVFTELLSKGNDDEAFSVASTIINFFAILLTIVIAICCIFMPAVISICAPGFRSNEELFQHTVRLSFIIFPTIIFLAVSGVIIGMLNSFNHFTAPAAGPVLWNIVIISMIILFQNKIGIYSAAWGILIGTAAQFSVLLLPFKRLKIRYKPIIKLKDENVRRIFRLILPVSITLGIVNLNVFVDTIFASYLGPRSIAAIDSAFRIFHLPMAIFAIAIGTALFPMLSRFSVDDDEKFKKTLQSGIGQIFYLTIPCSIIFFIMSVPIVKLVFERGSFSESDTVFVADALTFFAVGLPFTSANTLLNRGFYSLKKNWAPAYVGIFNIALNAFLDWIFMKRWGHAGICLSTSMVSMFNFIALTTIMKKTTNINISAIAVSLFKISVASLPVGLLSFYIFSLFIDSSRGILFGPILLLSLIIPSSLYILITTFLKIDESEIT